MPGCVERGELQARTSFNHWIVHRVEIDSRTKQNKVSDLKYLLFKIAASELLASYMHSQILTVSNENRCSHWSYKHSTVFTFVHIDLHTILVKSKLMTYLGRMVKDVNSAVFKEAELENRPIDLRCNLGEGLACLIGEHEVSTIDFLFRRHYVECNLIII